MLSEMLFHGLTHYRKIVVVNITFGGRPSKSRNFEINETTETCNYEKITITSKDISQKQWSQFVLEMNLIKKAWRSPCKYCRAIEY